MASAPSRVEVEQLHRLMLQASNDAAQVERRLASAQKDDGLSAVLRRWQAAADVLEAALQRLRKELEAEGTPRAQVDRIRERLGEIKVRTRRFDLDQDLEICAGHWKALGVEMGQLSGPHRGTLVGLLERQKPAVDEVTAQLSRARGMGGLLPDSHHRVRGLREERDRARANYERLREKFLEADRKGHEAGPPREPRALQTPLPAVAGRAAKGARVPPQKAAPPPLQKPVPARRPSSPAEHSATKFDHVLGSLIHEARAVRGGQAGKDQLARSIGEQHERGSGVATRLEQTLRHLATASHRALTDGHHGEVRNHLARMDSILARLRGRAGRELAEGAQEVGQILSALGSMTSSKGGARAVHELKGLIEDRRTDLLKMFGRQAQAKPALQQRAQIEQLRKLNPGLDKILRGASAAQLASQLARQDPSALAGLRAKPNDLAQNLFGGLSGGAHLGGAGGGHRGGLAALSGSSALAKALDHEVRHAPHHETGKVLAALKQAPAGTPIHTLARKAEERHKELLRRHPVAKGPSAAQVTAGALSEAFRGHPKAGSYRQHVAPGGAIWELCNAAQRSRGLPVGQFASHFLQGRGEHKLLGAVQTFNTLVKEGHRPHFGLFDRLKKAAGSVTSAMSQVANSAANAVSSTVKSVVHTVTDPAGPIRGGVSSLNRGINTLVDRGVRGIDGAVRRAASGVGGVVRKSAQAIGHAASAGAHWLAGKGHAVESAVARTVRNAGHTLAHVVQATSGRIDQGANWAAHKAGQAAHWTQDKVHSGIEWMRKTGVVGAIGTGLKKGLHVLGEVAKHTPLGIAARAANWARQGGLSKVWEGTKHLAGRAWEGIKQGYKATAGFLQSPAGQLLVTGLSLAATFIPGGVVVKAIIGGGIGAIQAISEGKDWKGVLASAAGGAVAGALPFLKIGPLAKIGIGALQGGLTTLASGGSLKDALKGAAGGAVDSFDPGALKALGRLKGVRAAEKLLTGKTLSKAQKAWMAESKLAGPLRGLEKLAASPRFRRTMGGLEKVRSGATKGAIWLSGKAGKIEHGLDRALAVGDKVHGALETIHANAPALAEVVGDNALGHLIGKAGEVAGAGDERLAKALAHGHQGRDVLGKYHGYLDKGLGYGGVKDPQKAYQTMMARRGARAGDKKAIQEDARLRLEKHKLAHPDLYAATKAKQQRPRAPMEAKAPRTALEKAIARGKELKKKGLEVARGVHSGLGKVHAGLQKGIDGADKVQHGLEKAAELARQGAGIVGEETELGKYLLHASERAEHAHGWVEQGISVAQDYNERLGKVNDALGHVPGVKGGKKEAPDQVEFIDGKKKTAKKSSPHDKPKIEPQDAPAHETDEQRKLRLKKAWEALGSVSSRVDRFESRFGKSQRRIHELLAKGQANDASIELQSLGAECEEIATQVREASKLSRGHEAYAKQAAFYADWHAQTKARLQRMIAETKGLGGQVQITGFGISEQTHPDIFANTREIFALRSKVAAFGDAIHDPDAKEHQQKLLGEAKAAKAHLTALKGKYKKDRKAHDFLTGGGEQDRLIDEVIKRLEKPAAAAKPKPAAEKPARPGLVKRVEHGLKALDGYRKKAVKAGRKIDHGLGRVEEVLGKGMKAGSKVDHGLEQVAQVADQMARLFGEESPLGHFAEQVSHGAGKGHEKLHQALEAGKTGQGWLKKGHELFHQGLEAAAGHHKERIEKRHGKVPHEGPVHHRELVHGQPGKLGHDAAELWKGGKKSVHDGGHAWGDAGEAGHHASDLWGHLRSHDWKHAFGDARHLAGDAKHLASDGTKLWSDGKGLWSEGKRVIGDLRHLFGHGRDPGALVEDALSAVAQFGQAVSAGLKEIEALMQAQRTKEAAARVQAVSAVSEATRAKVAAAVQAAAGNAALSRQARDASRHYLAIRAQFFKFVSTIHGLPELSGEEQKREHGAPAQLDTHAHRPGKRRTHDPLEELIDSIVGAGGGHIHADRGSNRGDDQPAYHDIDPAAMDTWIGSGQGVELFSEVFGAFIPAEGALVHAHAGGQGGHRGRSHGEDGEAESAAGGHGRRGKRGKKKGTILGHIGKLLPKSVHGFFSKLFDQLHGFADRVAGMAHAGKGLLGKAMHYAEAGMHGLSGVEHAAEGVHDLAGRAEGFLSRMGLGKAASFAHQIGGAAGWVDKEAQLVHGGLRSADGWMGKGRKVAGQLESGAHGASAVFDKAAHGKLGGLLHLFKASKSGDGIDGKLSPEKARLGSSFDDPKRLDVSTISRMETFLGGSFGGVRIHTGPGAAEITRRFAAEAVTVKDHVFFAPGRYNPGTLEGQKLIAHELTHVMQRGRANMDVRTAEGEALHSEHSFGHAPAMETLNLGKARANFRLASDGEGMGAANGIHTAKRTRSRGHETGAIDNLPDGEVFIEQISTRVYDLLMEEMEQAFESR